MNLIGKTPENEVLNAPAPGSTDTYTAIEHRQIVDQLFEELDKKDIKVEKSQYTANDNRNQVAAQHLLSIEGMNDNVMGPAINWGNSYDKTKRFTMASGAITLVCTNGMIGLRDVMEFSRKHTGNAMKDVENMIQQVVNNLETTFEKFQRQMEILQYREITKRMAGEFLGRLYFEEQILTPTQLNEVKRNYFTDENFKCNSEGNNSAFNFYNNVTEALKSTHPNEYIRKHAKFNAFSEAELIS